MNINEKVSTLINSMSIREKVGQTVMIEPVFCLEDLNKKGMGLSSITDPRFLDILFNQYKIGFLLYGGVTRIGNDHILDWAGYIKEVNKYIQEHDYLPVFYGVDAIHGVNFVKGTTIYPHNLGAISSWNTELVSNYMENVSKELHSMGININFAPTIDVSQDQRWGRVYESFGEDPFLASKMSKAMVEGAQKASKVAATAKHFVGYGASNTGMDRTPADISERSLKETHLPPFVEAINSDVKSIMVNGGDLNGTPIHVSRRLLIDTLRKDLGFNGFTMSDWEDVHRLVERHKVVRSKEEALLRAFNSGLDMNMAVSDLHTVDVLEKLVQEGKIKEEYLNEVVSRILRVKFELGLFDFEEINLEKVSKREHLNESKELAEKLSLESLTLLKNEDNLLPLSKDIKSVLLTGKAANSKRHMCGGWTLNWASANEEDLDFPTIYDVLKQRLGSGVKLTYCDSLESLNKLNPFEEDFDVCISVVGEEPHSEWLGDSYDLAIEEDEMEVLKRVTKTKIPTVMVSLIGRPQKMCWMDKHIQSILWAYLPGSEGSKPIVDVIFGDENPSGKLPITFPKDANQIPILYNARRYDSYEIQTKYEPLYPFGYGLSYTTFAYKDLEVVNHVELGKDVEVKVTVTNTGKMKGTEIVHLYLTDVYASVTRPMRSLKGFDRVTLNPGESKVVSIILTPKEFSLFDEYLNFVQEPREIDIHIKDLVSRIKIG